jgi:hypothetical protein
MQQEANMRRLTRPLAAAVLAAVLLVPTAIAQTQSPPQSVSPGQSAGTPSIPDDKLDAAAAAAQKVVSIKENYQQRIEAAAPTDKQRIADEGKDALVRAVTDQGISVEEYTSIIVVAENDAAVREKLLERIRSSAK